MVLSSVRSLQIWGSGLTGLEALGVMLTRNPWFIALGRLSDPVVYRYADPRFIVLGKLGAFSDRADPVVLWFERWGYRYI